MKKFVHIGADPEFFYINKGEFDEFPINYSIPPVVFRKKKLLTPIRVFNRRHYVFWEEGNYVLHEDGAAFELTTPPFNNIIEMRESVLAIINEAQKDLGIEFTIIPAAKFIIPEKYVNDKEFIKACEFGCNPDIEGYMPEINLTTHTISAEDIPFRFGGGHIMIEFPEELKELMMNYHDIFSQFLAITVGLRMIAFTKFPELIKERAKYYGTPCKYRDNKLHKGLFEYRTPSNEWLLFNEQQLLEIENGINIALTLFHARDELARNFLKNYIDNVAKIIYKADVNSAKKLVDKIRKEEEKIK